MKPEDAAAIKEKLYELRSEAITGVKKHVDSIKEVLKGSPISSTRAVAEESVPTDVENRLTVERRKKLKMIEDALENLNIGTYGICGDCGEPIEVKRLLAMPFANKCCGCKSAQEALELEESKGKRTRPCYNN